MVAATEATTAIITVTIITIITITTITMSRTGDNLQAAHITGQIHM
jgi:hypothetical protein